MNLLITGLPGSGKTTLTNKLLDYSNFIVLKPEYFREHIFGEVSSQPKCLPEHIRRETYYSIFLTSLYLNQYVNKNQIIQGTILKNEYILKLKELVDDYIIVYLEANEEDLIERLKKRENCAGEGTIEVYYNLKKSRDNNLIHDLRFDTSQMTVDKITSVIINGEGT